MTIDFQTLFILDCKVTLWESAAAQPAGQINEIFAMDIAVIDTSKNQIIDKDKFYIKPQKSKIGQYCENLYGISQSRIDKLGIPFLDVYRKLRVYHMTRDRLWGSWGIADKYAINEQCKNLELESLFSKPHKDIRHLYSMLSGQKPDTFPQIYEALKFCEMANTDNEAVNIANIVMRMGKGLRPQIRRIILPTSKSN